MRPEQVVEANALLERLATLRWMRTAKLCEVLIDNEDVLKLLGKSQADQIRAAIGTGIDSTMADIVASLTALNVSAPALAEAAE